MSPSCRNIFLMFAFSIIVFIGGCDNTFTLYKNPQNKIKIKYPKTWKVIENKDGAAAIFISPKETALDAYQENLSIVIQNLPQSLMPLRQYSKEAVNQITQTLKNIQVVRNEETSLSGSPAYRFEYIIKLNFNLKITHVWTIINNKTYQLTFGCDMDHCKDYDDFASTMFATFEAQ